MINKAVVAAVTALLVMGAGATQAGILGNGIVTQTSEWSVAQHRMVQVDQVHPGKLFHYNGRGVLGRTVRTISLLREAVIGNVQIGNVRLGNASGARGGTGQVTLLNPAPSMVQPGGVPGG